MSEADYMDDCQHSDRWDEENKPEATHEVKMGGRIVFAGSRAAAWSFKHRYGGYVQEDEDE